MLATLLHLYSRGEERLMRRTLMNVGIMADAGQLGLSKQLCCEGASKFPVGANPLASKLLPTEIEN